MNRPDGRKLSLRARMLMRVLVPLAFTWLAGSAVAVGVAVIFTRQAFDRSMLDDAAAIAAHVDERSGEPALALSERELRAILFDQNEQVFFAVLRADGSLVAGDAGLRADIPSAAAPIEVSDVRRHGTELRMASVRRASARSRASTSPRSNGLPR